MPNITTRVLLVEDHPIVCAGVHALVGDLDNVLIIGETGDGNEAVRLAAQLKPDLIIMDIGLTGCNGIEATKQIKAQFPNMKILIFSGHYNEAEIIAALAAGASGFCGKILEFKRLSTAITAVIEDSTYLDPTVANLMKKI